MTLSDGLFLEKLGVIPQGFCLWPFGPDASLKKVLTILEVIASKKKTVPKQFDRNSVL